MLSELLATCDYIAKRNLCPATGGNFSIRQSGDKMLMSASGKDKANLKASDFVVCNFQAQWLEGEGKPSAEAALHGMIYRLSPQTQCVLHTHSIPVTVLSMLEAHESAIRFHGYEMQKTIAGFHSHEETLNLFVFDNNQHIPTLAIQLMDNWQEAHLASGLIVRGHGLYSWGNSVHEAKRHMEGLEFLVECELTRKRYQK
ncbi:methylthioribulose 1-phosphate dehydratase [Candidatus Berkiella aquae]|uniref:Methylthioribulose-1-phosphate dehydratase n=1 Tax=Candidatus Berkiella aquae TaxID=295108 RepID=A0A0Q9YLX7_9GAMM|nr:methylthioribulose 1-phosphate dehydratase [Candidatus Berkiella aquae]MCS5711318.1 methylthioribulose 1-phosphate dehydratase [Candidatus Berkiella aquae]